MINFVAFHPSVFFKASSFLTTVVTQYKNVVYKQCRIPRAYLYENEDKIVKQANDEQKRWNKYNFKLPQNNKQRYCHKGRLIRNNPSCLTLTLYLSIPTTLLGSSGVNGAITVPAGRTCYYGDEGVMGKASLRGTNSAHQTVLIHTDICFMHLLLSFQFTYSNVSLALYAL